MSLVELLVAMAVGVTVLAILFGTFHQTRRLALREVTRNRQRQEATLTLERVSAVIADAVPVASLDVASEVEEVFEPNRLRVVSWRGADAEQVWLHEIFHETTGEDDSRVLVRRVSLDGAEEESTTQPENLWQWVGLRYATELHGDGSVVWSSAVEPGKFPALVEVTVASHFMESDTEPFILSSVVSTSLGGGQ